MNTLLIDNYDSFSYNIFQMLAKINGHAPSVIQNDSVHGDEIDFSYYDNIVISPGPGNPDSSADFGLCKHIIQTANIPVLGICLGHQGIASAFGGRVIPADVPVHGQQSHVTHNCDPLFNNIPSPFKVVRYHSLIVDPDLPNALDIICWTEQGTIMGIRHKNKCIRGVQFHPESICTEHGYRLFKNFYAITKQFYRDSHHHWHHSIANSNKSVKPIKSNAHTHVLQTYKIDLSIDGDALYSHLHQTDKNAIWLDSSLSENHKTSLSIIALSTGPLSFLLRYSIQNKTIETLKNNKTVSKEDGTLFDYLEKSLSSITIKPSKLPFDYHCGFIGYLGYELKQDVLPIQNRHYAPYSDAQLLFSDRSIIIDHSTKQCYLLALNDGSIPNRQISSWFSEMVHLITHTPPLPTPDTQVQTLSNFSLPDLEMNEPAYLHAITQCKQRIKSGDSYEICLTNRFRQSALINPLNYYLSLRTINPSPYAAFLPFEHLQIASSSIERFLKIDRDGWIESKPIKGTLPRKEDPVEDAAMKTQLKNDIKFISENLMIVDLLRNDLGKVSEIGSVTVPKLMDIESYKNVHQLVSTIRGKKRKDLSAIDCLKACFPGGSMTGAPKIRTVEIIDELEQSARGVYSGAIGYFSLNGAMDLSMVIRTAVMHQGLFEVGVGGAIIDLSNPQAEYEEMLLKAKPLLSALKRHLEPG